MTVKILSGAAIYYDERGRSHVVTSESGVVSLGAKLESKLVGKGKAVCMSTPVPVASPAVEQAVTETVDETDYSKMTNPQLKALCDEMGIEFSGRPTKAEMIAALEGEDEAPVFDALDAE